MKTLFVCVKCAFAVERDKMESHYEKCLDKPTQMEHYVWLKWGLSDQKKNDLVVVRGLNAQVVNKA